MVETNSPLIEKYFNKVRDLYPNSFLTDERINSLLLSAKSEDHIRTVFYYLSLAMRSSPDLRRSGNHLFLNVDESSYDLAQWIDAIHFFHVWLLDQERKTTFVKLVGYINCCSESPENRTLKYSLEDLLKKMLAEYGYQG